MDALLPGYRLACASLVAGGIAIGTISSFAQGASISVFPTTVTLSGSMTSASVQLTNEAAVEARFQATLHAWSMSASGEMELASTEDLVAFPTVFALKPGESRSIRVGANRRAQETELSYRLIVQELAQESDASSTSGVQMLRRLNIPIFLPPADRQLKAELHSLSLERAGLFSLRARNFGTVHFMVGEMVLEGRDAGGQTVVSARRDGWYVLPGNDIRYEIEFDPTTCTKLSTITVTMRLRGVSVEPLVETIAVEAGRCERL